MYGNFQLKIQFDLIQFHIFHISQRLTTFY